MPSGNKPFAEQMVLSSMSPFGVTRLQRVNLPSYLWSIAAVKNTIVPAKQPCGIWVSKSYWSLQRMIWTKLSKARSGRLVQNFRVIDNREEFGDQLPCTIYIYIYNCPSVRDLNVANMSKCTSEFTAKWLYNQSETKQKTVYLLVTLIWSCPILKGFSNQYLTVTSRHYKLLRRRVHIRVLADFSRFNRQISNACFYNDQK